MLDLPNLQDICIMGGTRILCNMDDLGLFYQGHRGCKAQRGEYMMRGFVHFIINLYKCYITDVLGRQNAIVW